MVEGRMNWIESRIRKIMTRISKNRMSITELSDANREESVRKECRSNIGD
jgi:hypothetical protein